MEFPGVGEFKPRPPAASSAPASSCHKPSANPIPSHQNSSCESDTKAEPREEKQDHINMMKGLVYLCSTRSVR
jgi:hypothetical protein